MATPLNIRVFNIIKRTCAHTAHGYPFGVLVAMCQDQGARNEVQAVIRQMVELNLLVCDGLKSDAFIPASLRDAI